MPRNPKSLADINSGDSVTLTFQPTVAGRRLLIALRENPNQAICHAHDEAELDEICEHGWGQHETSFDFSFLNDPTPDWLALAEKGLASIEKKVTEAC